MNGRYKRLMDMYARGRMPYPGERFQVIGATRGGLASVRDEGWGVRVHGLLSQDAIKHGGIKPLMTFAVQGEIGLEWLEMVEVASYFNDEADGAIYYVGNMDSHAILLPAWDEIRASLGYYRATGEIFKRPGH